MSTIIVGTLSKTQNTTEGKYLDQTPTSNTQLPLVRCQEEREGGTNRKRECFEQQREAPGRRAITT